MLPSEEAAVLIFLGAVLAVYFTAAWIAAHYLCARFARKAPDFTRRWLWALRVIMGLATLVGLATLGLLCAAYAYFVEPYWPEVTHVRIATPKLPKGSRPIRIVHVSDLHSDPKPRLEARLPGIVAAQEPDLIVFTGDAANGLAGMPLARRCLSAIAEIAPTFAVTGNWDSPRLYDGTGVRLLHAQAVRLDVRGVQFWLGGLASGTEASLPSAFDGVPRGALVVFLYHMPDLIYRLAERHVDLCLAGHTHGGQVALPFYGALVTLSQFGKRFEAGLYRVGETWLYVNRGIGMEGGPLPRVRFWSRPEITVVELAPAE
jgi:predicted MPP superfamily phosphohydrolase